MRITFESVVRKRQTPSLKWVGLTQPIKGLNRTKGRVRENLLCLVASQLGQQSSALGLALHHWLSWVSSLLCRYQMAGLYRLHNHISQFFIIDTIGCVPLRTQTNTILFWSPFPCTMNLKQYKLGLLSAMKGLKQHWRVEIEIRLVCVCVFGLL